MNTAIAPIVSTNQIKRMIAAPLLFIRSDMPKRTARHGTIKLKYKAGIPCTQIVQYQIQTDIPIMPSGMLSVISTQGMPLLHP
jgi:hypothetical protein